MNIHNHSALRAALPLLFTALMGPTPSEAQSFPQVRISEAGGTGDGLYDATFPKGAFDPNTRLFFVVWQADDNDGGLANNETEIFGRMVDEDGIPLGSGDRRLTEVGTDGDATRLANFPAVAHNPFTGEFLVVWIADDPDFGLADNREEVFGQRFERDGGFIGGPFQISDMDDNASGWSARNPVVACSNHSGHCLVVWEGQDDDPGRQEGTQIYGQLLDSDGGPIGTDDLAISQMGDDSSSWGAHDAQVVHNPRNDEYMVVWSGSKDNGVMAPNEREIFAQRVAADGSEIGTDDLQISGLGGAGSTTSAAVTPSIAHNPHRNEYLVVYVGDEVSDGHVDNEFEVFARRLNGDGSLGAGAGRISDMGGVGDPAYSAGAPRVIYEAFRRSYLVVWDGNDDLPDTHPNKNQIFSQRLNQDGVEIGVNDLQISFMGQPLDDTTFADRAALLPYMVLWDGSFDQGGLVPGELEVFGRRRGVIPLFFDGFEATGAAVIQP